MNSNQINIEANKQLELKMVESIKKVLDPGSFVRPLSEFFAGTNEIAFGLWLSGEGGSNINEYPIADYYNENLFDGCKELKDWMNTNNMYLSWYDCGTIFLYFK